MKLGDIVIFKDKVYGPAYAPYYDEYKGHTFIVTGFFEGGHVGVKCTTSTTIEDFCCHDDELEEIINEL
jgi:hypothetical protein